MANELLWKPKTVGDLLATELNNLVDATMVVDVDDYNNATNKYRWASFFFFGTWDAPCDDGAVIELHLFYKLDGTKYGDGEDGDVVNAQGSGNSHHGLFQIGIQADAYQQVLRVPLDPFAFRVGIKMACGQDLTPVDTHWLKMYPYNEEQQ